MALWPFGKKKDEEAETTATTATPASEAVDATPDAGVNNGVNAPSALSGLGAVDEPEDVDDPSAGEPDPTHDAINGETGPFDGGSVNIQDFDFSDFSKGILDLGSLQVPLPLDSEVQVEMGEQGPRMLHIVTKYGRITPVAFAAPTSAGQWREATKDIAEGMRRDGLSVRVERGPWGREVVGEANDRQIRIAGVDGPRWMLRMTMISPADRADDMRDLGREVIARTFVNRGDAPILAGSPLPVALPKQLAEQVQQAMAQRAAQAKAQSAQPNLGNPTQPE
ncbi:hypothetical protein CDES_08505 [Corynebacterium deserti GIMN1.010]|uniref:DUF3710 domain-containing protein n=1 Tax=Corynebacterium deserti GIMN1.010 TaxID=931089 RepID=A0A0M5ILQ6_9CORY|nr:DUF3710 domain-containing protein [Corynebacterium deserti]ALC06094.1 hypothetical protein CDES_08505 [Corynebacterium deserti GIMN1.010]